MFHGAEVDVIETAGVHHIIVGVRSRAVKGRDAAVTTELMPRPLRTEPIGREILLSLEEAKAVRGNHVVEIALAPADGAVAFADSGEIGPNLEPNPPAVTGTSVELHIRPSFAVPPTTLWTPQDATYGAARLH
jgi:hypothetical protein